MRRKRLIEKVREAIRQPQQDEGTPFHLPEEGFGSFKPRLRKVEPEEADSYYQKRYNEASELTGKGNVLIEYNEQCPEHFRKSSWVKTALADFPHFQVVGERKEKGSAWYESSQEVINRRRIVLKNASLPGRSLCKAFDMAGVPLPEGWEAELGVTTWVGAYQNTTSRARIQKIISTDKRQK